MEVRHVRRWPLVLCGGLGGLFAAMALGVAAPDRKEGVSAPLVGQAELSNPTKPVPYSVADRDRRLSEKGMTAGSPVMIRIFKAEFELELWLQKEGRFELFATYPICFWSGGLGPKLREGDRQAPEGHLLGGHRAAPPRGSPSALARPRLSQRARSSPFAHRLLHPGARRLQVDRLLRHDQPGDRGDLQLERAGLAPGPGPHPGARLPVSHDRGQPQGRRRAAPGTGSGRTSRRPTTPSSAPASRPRSPSATRGMS